MVLNHVVRRGRAVKDTTTPPTKPNPIPAPQPVTEAPEQAKATATRKTTRPEKPEPKPTAGCKLAAWKPTKKAAVSTNTAAGKPKTPNLVVPTQSSTSPLEEISYLLDHLHLQACVELNCRLLTSISSLPTGGARPRTEQGKALRLTCWNVDGVCRRKLELERFLNQHGVDICILRETFLNPGQAFRLANVCHRKLTAGGGTANLVRRGIVHHSVPVTGLTHLVATAIQAIMISDNPCGIPFAFPPTDRSGPYRLFRRGLPVVMAGDLNAKHTDWNSRLSTRPGKLLRDYADETCVIFGPDSPTTKPYNPSATPGVLDITSYYSLATHHLTLTTQPHRTTAQCWDSNQYSLLSKSTVFTR